MRRVAVLTLALLAFAGAAPASRAAEPTQAQAQAIRAACPGDFQKLCAGVTPGGAAALQCLEKNLGQLSGSCQSAVAAVAGTAAAAPAAPAAPAATGASGSGAGSAAPQPQAAAPAPAAPASPPPLLTPRQEIFLVRNACRADVRRLCGAVPLGGGRVIECLEARKADLSPRCVTAIGEVRGP